MLHTSIVSDRLGRCDREMTEARAGERGERKSGNRGNQCCNENNHQDHRRPVRAGNLLGPCVDNKCAVGERAATTSNHVSRSNGRGNLSVLVSIRDFPACDRIDLTLASIGEPR
jgi:hypothetical protein